MSDILVVIPTIFNNSFRENLLNQLCEESLVKQVVVVDNGNCFNLPEAKQQAWAKVQRIQAGCNLNWLASCNLGAAIAVAQQIPYVCFLNDDVRLSNPFFKEMLKTFTNCKNAAVVVPKYTGGFCQQARDLRNENEWKPEEKEQAVPFVDGTCMLFSLQTIQTVGLLDPIFQSPGWGADVDYAYRVRLAGKALYVSHRAMLWHGGENGEGGTSATQIYGGRARWKNHGIHQAARDLAGKYGHNWRNTVGLPRLAFVVNKLRKTTT